MGVLPHTDPIKNYKHVFDVCTEDRVYHLSAESSEDKWSWVNTLQNLLFPPKVHTYTHTYTHIHTNILTFIHMHAHTHVCLYLFFMPMLYI